MPAGTGNVLRSLRRVAAQNDKAILEMKQQAAEEASQQQQLESAVEE